MKSKAEVMKDLGKVRRRKIIIQKKIDDFDDIGNPVEIWANWKTIRVERSSLWGQEYYAAQAVGEEKTVVFIAKWVSFLDDLNVVEYRILFDGKAYDIKNIDPLQDDGMWVKIKATERPADTIGMMLIDHPLVSNLKGLIEQILADETVSMEPETIEAYEDALAELMEGQ